MGKAMRTPQKWSVVTTAMKYRSPSTGKLRVGAAKKVSNQFKISVRTLNRFIREYENQGSNTATMSRKSKNSGRPSKLDEDTMKNIRSIMQEYATRRIYLTNRRLAEADGLLPQA
mmetsp:Transcript_29021/g.48767  ORF Transcript_29021/g.48767 Transcript_29021/m.48767 type:complete len:115 (-) Transcript_29021:2-346(-)